MTTQNTTGVEQQFALTLDTLDTSLNKVYCHYVLPQQGALSHELILLPTVTALCGYEFKPTDEASAGSPLCPACDSTWTGR